MPKIAAIDVGVLEYEPDTQWFGKFSRQAATFVRVRLESGVEGVSVSWNDSPSTSAMALTIGAWFSNSLIGMDVRFHPASSEPQMQKARWNGSSCAAVAAIDNALWDAKAKVDGLPLHALFGSHHESLPVYAVSRRELSMKTQDEIIDHILQARDLGYRAYKPHLWGARNADIAACEAIRRTLGDGFGLMLDPLGRYSLTDALQVGRAIEQLGYLWLEDPIPSTERHAYPWLGQKLDIPLIASDNVQWSCGDYVAVASSQCPIALRLDAGRQGITFCRKIMEFATSYGVRSEFHAFGPEPNCIAGLHLAIAQREMSYYEGCVPTLEHQVPGVRSPSKLNGDGRIEAPQAPGVGLELDWAYLDGRMNWLEVASGGDTRPS